MSIQNAEATQEWPRRPSLSFFAFAPFLPFIRPMARRLTLLTILLIVGSLLEGVGVALFYPLIDYIQHPDTFLANPSRRPSVMILAKFGLSPSVALFITFIFAVILVALVCKSWAGILSSKIHDRLVYDLRRDTFSKVLSSHIFYFTNSSSAQLGNVLEFETASIGKALRFTVDIAANGFSLIFYIAFAFFLSWQLTIFVAVLGLIRFWVCGIFFREMWILGEENEHLAVRLKSFLTGIHQGIDVVKAFGTEADEERRFDRVTSKMFANSSRIAVLQAQTSFYAMLLGDAVLCFVVWIAISYLNISSTALFTFLFIGSRVIPRVTGINDLRVNVTEYLSRVITLPHILSESGLPTLKWGTTPKSRFEDRIRFDEVSFQYPGTGKLALENITLELRRNETLAVVGKSGSGKSTLTRLLLRLFDPTSGQIMVDGLPISELRREDWTKLVSVVSQDTFVFDDTLEANIKYAAPACSDEEFRNAVRRAGCDEFIQHLPHKEKTEIGERGVRLSGGQRQRVAIARAFLRNSPILILDEATSAMDSLTERLIQDALHDLARDRTLLIIAHRLSTIRSADHIVVLDQGRVSAVGTHEELLVIDEMYNQFHTLQTSNP